MGGEVTVYSGLLGAGLAAGISGISRKLSPGMSSKPGIWGICMPLIGGMPPIISLDIMELLEELENDEDEELENDDEDMEDILEDMFPILIPPPIFPMSIFPIILLIISSIPRDFMSRIPPMPPMLIMGGIGPPDPEDIIVDDDDEEDDD